MARDQFNDVITRSLSVTGTGTMLDGIDVLQPLSGVQVTVYKMNADGTRQAAPANIFNARGPTDNTAHANPFVTTSGGKVSFWADPGDYDIVYHDTITPARIGDQSGGWEALSGADSSIPGILLPGGGDFQVKTGMVFSFAGMVAPSGFLICDGSIKLRTDYPALFAVVSTNFNTGGESGAQFRLPDLRGRVEVGMDDLGTALGDAGRLAAVSTIGKAGGEETHGLTSAEIPELTISGNNGIDGAGSARYVPSLVLKQNTNWKIGTNNPGGDGQANVINEGRGTSPAHNNMQPHQFFNKIVKT